MSENEPESPSDDELQRLLRELLSGAGGVDAAQLAGAAGLPSDPASLAALMAQLQQALHAGTDGIDWTIAGGQAEQRAAANERQIEPSEREALSSANTLAELWLDEATHFGQTGTPVRLVTRRQWVSTTMPVWTELAEPVATSVADALMGVIREQAPEAMSGLMADAGNVFRNVGGTLFAMQLGNVVGQLAAEVMSGGDVGLPLIPDSQPVLIPQNLAAFGRDLDVPASEVALYVTVRELAHARLFRHARWLRLEFIRSLTEFARGIHIDIERLQEIADGFNPAEPEELQRALRDGSLIPPKTPAQIAALEQLETTLALIEGWVDSVTTEATRRLPSAGALAEMVRRRRATGGPAESAFAALVGLELRPRRLREATAMWDVVLGECGIESRDALWLHPDAMPTQSDIDDPQRLVGRLNGTAQPSDEDRAFDAALDELLRGDAPPAPEDPVS